MTFAEALQRLGVSDNTLTSSEKSALDNQGYLIVGGLIGKSSLARMRAGFENAADRQRQAKNGKESGTRHINNLLSDNLFVEIFTKPKALAAIYHMLGVPFKLAQINGRDPLPGFGAQGLHADWLPRMAGEPYQIVTILWLLDDFTADNGATRLVPGSHKQIGQIPKSFSDQAARHPQQIIVNAPAGSALIFNGHLWHSGTRNNSRASRRVLQTSFVGRETRYFGSEEIEVSKEIDPLISIFF